MIKRVYSIWNNSAEKYSMVYTYIYLYMYTVSQKKTSPFYFCDLCQMSSNFVNLWKKHSLRGECVSAPCLWQHGTSAQTTLHFTAPDLWPPNTRDWNPFDYKVYGFKQDRVYHTPILDVADLKQRLVCGSISSPRPIHDITVSKI